MIDVLVLWVDNAFWMSNKIFTALVGSQVGPIDAVDFFSRWVCNVVQFDGVSSASKESIAGLNCFHDLEGVDQSSEVFVGFNLSAYEMKN